MGANLVQVLIVHDKRSSDHSLT